ncbi:leucine/isoleucine/valine-binding protein [Sulfurimonas gotlandica GD1]|uniref:Leucine/isoleucine/valine-binding protein n=1 Tax=Sulfurimonas gotlandica (strain DSM 19862 / JCM 16533 / GD1) TaxID=929558 RepID=B6BLI5_SULGG|nr:ABC transporter substrate-binding protein [Sulfurimonas gotlandica]EDZ61968.1 extracellular ligand-binding receptor [Sulfurimonas gotlandica GD1]EHP28643.1 leucine/isoleucine/valine-binding protein [Sulfurimonas gotlandica GD1]
MIRYIVVVLIAFVLIFLNIENDELDGKSLKLGLSIPRSGIMHALGDSVYSGADSYFLYANQNKLLGDVKIELIVYDDKYEPDMTVENIKKLIDKNIFAFFGFVGTPTVKKILPNLRAGEIPLVAPFTGASFLRNNDGVDIVNFRSSYKEEIDYTVEYLRTKRDLSKFAVFYQNDDYGEEGFVSLLHSLNERGLKLCGEGTYKRNTLSIRHAFHEIKSSKPEAVFMIGAYKANALFIKTAKKDPIFKDTLFCNISFGDADEMIRELDYNTENLFFSQVVPSYDDSSKPVILEYKKLMKKYFPDEPLGFVSLEAFLAAKSVVVALKNIGGAITREKFLQEIKKLPKNILDGVDIDYKNDQLHNKVYLFKYKNSKFIEVYNEN